MDTQRKAKVDDVAKKKKKAYESVRVKGGDGSASKLKKKNTSASKKKGKGGNVGKAPVNRKCLVVKLTNPWLRKRTTIYPRTFCHINLKKSL